MTIIKKHKSLFNHLNHSPQLALEQTKALTGLHLDESLDIIQLTHVETNNLIENDGVVALNIYPDRVTLAIVNQKAPNTWIGHIIHDGPHHNTPNLGKVEFLINQSNLTGQINLNNETFLIIPIGADLHVICRQKNASAA